MQTEFITHNRRRVEILKLPDGRMLSRSLFCEDSSATESSCILGEQMCSHCSSRNAGYVASRSSVCEESARTGTNGATGST